MTKSLYAVPDSLDVYYDGQNIFSSGLLSSSGQFVIAYGPGASDSLTIVVDQDGALPFSLWTYTPTIDSGPRPTLTVAKSSDGNLLIVAQIAPTLMAYECVLESTTDFVNWTAISTNSFPANRMITNSLPAAASMNFFRANVR